MNRTTLILCQSGSLLALTVFAYIQVRHHHFVWDTIPFVIENPWVHELTFENLKSMFTESFRANWHPLVLLSHAIDISVFGLNPGPHHVINVPSVFLSSFLPACKMKPGVPTLN